jgi:hypothetical protein
MFNQVQEHLKKYNILAEERFGFRGESSTNKAIYKLINESLQALNSKSPVGGIFFGLENAFDCLNHDILSNYNFMVLMVKLNNGLNHILTIDIKEFRFWKRKLIKQAFLHGER